MASYCIRSSLPNWLAVFCACVHVLMLAFQALFWSPTVDEVGHLASAICHFQTGSFDLYRVNPPLVRMFAGIPIALFDSERVDAPENDYARAEFSIGQSYVHAKGEQAFGLFTLARWACFPLSLLGAFICFVWSRELFGPWAGTLALSLWCFCPNIMGHGSLITPDVGSAALAIAASYAFWHWLKAPGASTTFLGGIMLGLAQLTKTTNLLLFAIFPLLWVFCRNKATCGTRFRQACQLCLIFLLAAFVLNLGYGFEGSFKALGSYQFVSDLFVGEEKEKQGGNRFSDTWFGVLHMPVPENYLRGIDVQRKDFESKKYSYLREEFRREGWWYYYLYGLLVKVPLGTWLLALLAIFVTIGFGPCINWRDELMLVVPPVGYLAFVSSQTGFNHHLRYILPVFPFAFIWISRVAAPIPSTLSLERKSMNWHRWIVPVLTVLFLGFSVYSSLRIYPHSLSFFNELVGGPINGPQHLLDSNIDWGQDLLFLKKWVDKHPEAKPLAIAYFGSFEPWVIYPQHFQRPPNRMPCPGWFAVSLNYLYGYVMGGHDLTQLYTWLQECEPVACAGYSIYIFYVTPEIANRLRLKRGLSLLGEGNK